MNPCSAKDLILLITAGVIPTKIWVDNLPDEDLHKIWARIHGVNTIRNGTKILRPGWFKRDLRENFLYNTQGLTRIITRSGWETEYIDYFESNQIPWAYEKYVIETLKKDGFHIPDFEIEINGEIILLEVKGSFYNQDREEYLSNKVGAAIQFAAKTI